MDSITALVPTTEELRNIEALRDRILEDCMNSGVQRSDTLAALLEASAIMSTVAGADKRFIVDRLAAFHDLVSGVSEPSDLFIHEAVRPLRREEMH